MARLAFGMLVLPAPLPNGTVDLTPWDPVTRNAAKRPFGAFSAPGSPTTPTPPPPCCFHVPAEERRRRAANASWVARQRALYAAAPGPRHHPHPRPHRPGDFPPSPSPSPQQQQDRDLGLRRGGGGGDAGAGQKKKKKKKKKKKGENKKRSDSDSDSDYDIAALYAAIRAGVRSRAARVRSLAERERIRARGAAAVLLFGALVWVLGLAALWAAVNSSRYSDGDDGDGKLKGDVVFYVLVRNYRAWSLTPPAPPSS